MAEVELEGREASVAYIGVIPEARGQGIGRALLSEAAKLAKKKGATLFRVRAHDHEKGALELYRNLGFSSRRRWPPTPRSSGPGGRWRRGPPR